ncbi:MAG: hypothetical protein WCT01_04930 [Candidatus Shapirobacteria bacterium]
MSKNTFKDNVIRLAAVAAIVGSSSLPPASLETQTKPDKCAAVGSFNPDKDQVVVPENGKFDTRTRALLISEEERVKVEHDGMTLFDWSEVEVFDNLVFGSGENGYVSRMVVSENNGMVVAKVTWKPVIYSGMLGDPEWKIHSISFDFTEGRKFTNLENPLKKEDENMDLIEENAKFGILGVKGEWEELVVGKKGEDGVWKYTHIPKYLLFMKGPLEDWAMGEENKT